MNPNMLYDWLASIPFFAAPFLLATVGLIINERAGVLNLGSEGIIAVSACLSIVSVLNGANPALGVAIGCLAAVVLAAVFAVLVVALRIEQVLAGLVTFALGVGVSGFIGSDFSNQPVPGIYAFEISTWLHLPKGLGHVLDQDILTYASFVVAVLVWWVIAKTEIGLKLRAVGEDAPAADAAGVNVFWTRFLAVLAGGVLLGLAGAHLGLVGSRIWVDGMVSGRGWIAVAMVTFSRWKPIQAIGAALLFGAVEAIIPRLLSSGMSVPVYLIQMAPYVATIVFLGLSGVLQKGESPQPQDLGRPFLREERR